MSFNRYKSEEIEFKEITDLENKIKALIIDLTIANAEMANKAIELNLRCQKLQKIQCSINEKDPQFIELKQSIDVLSIDSNKLWKASNDLKALSNHFLKVDKECYKAINFPAMDLIKRKNNVISFVEKSIQAIKPLASETNTIPESIKKRLKSIADAIYHKIYGRYYFVTSMDRQSKIDKVTTIVAKMSLKK